MHLSLTRETKVRMRDRSKDYNSKGKLFRFGRESMVKILEAKGILIEPLPSLVSITFIERSQGALLSQQRAGIRGGIAHARHIDAIPIEVGVGAVCGCTCITTPRYQAGCI